MADSTNIVNPGSAPGMNPGFDEDASASTPFTIGVIPDYLFAWESGITKFKINESVPFQWTIFRRDGGMVPVPETASFTITKPNLTTDTIAAADLYISSGTSATSITLGTVYTVDQFGDYVVSMTADLNDGSTGTQTRTASILVRTLYGY